jgi:hypothetical protein
MDYLYTGARLLIGNHEGVKEKYPIPDDDFAVIKEVTIEGKEISGENTDSSNYMQTLIKLNLQMRRESKENKENSSKTSKRILAEMRSRLEGWERSKEKLKKEYTSSKSMIENVGKQYEDFKEEKIIKNKPSKGNNWL